MENIIEGPVIVKGEDKNESIVRARELLAKVGLNGKENSYPRRLSGGQQQRVAIARALAMRPDVILFDEPTSALDPELVGEVLNTIRQLAQEKRTMVIVTHEMSFARDVADRAIFMDQGRIVEQGEAKALFANPQQPRTRQFLEKIPDAVTATRLRPWDPVKWRGSQATGVPASRRERCRRLASPNAWAAKWKPFWTIAAE
nr:cystine ABC transporter [Raoultella sp. NCTC 9187]